ncbi:hypothetical protein GN244_ATG11641 [Phytophthora infestans]|uniref:Myosin-like protein n=1 Tax=Phytophthora infestans TaxID=4787 RepID=A0A833T9A1_PHYIN|nr:hypothetical protein GN244_ATG11641 [Phytophthora infestans]
MTAAIKADTGLILSSEESNAAYTQALQDRHCGLYQDAVNALEGIIEHEPDSEKLWTELAITQFQLWEAHVRALHMPSILEVSSTTQSKRPGADAKPLHTVLLQEAYSTFLIAMEYPNSKSSPELLLPLVRLYIEFGSYRGALAVCTLLVEGYPTSPRLNEAIFLSALTASAMDRHRESAQYFQYLAEEQSLPPYRLAAYQFSLLAALELSDVPGMRALERETYTQAYKALVVLPPVLPSEKAAHILFMTSRKNEDQRTLIWCRDVQTWLDLAQRLAGPANAPLLVLSTLRQARRRMKPASKGFPAAERLLEGANLLRTGNNPGAEKVIAEALLRLPRDEYYIARHERFLLEMCSVSWRAHFALEHKSASRLQSFVWRCWRLVKWRLGVAYVLEQHRNVMVVRIQCAWRGLRARQEFELLREKQREKEELENVEMGDQDDRLIELHLNSTARKIQSLLQIARSKQTVRALRARKTEREARLAGFAERRIELGQLGVFRRWRGFVSFQKQARFDAAVLINRQFRAWHSRKLCNQMLLQRRQQNSILQQCRVRRSASLILRVFQAWHTELIEHQARCNMVKKAAQERLVATASQKPLERFFRQWEAAALLDKSVLHVRSSPFIKSTPVSEQWKPGTASGNKFDKPLTLEERAEIPSMLFYIFLNRVRQTGICQLSYSGGTVFKSPQIRQLISLSTSVIADGGGGLHTNSTSSKPLLNLNEQVVDALDACSSSLSNSCPVRSLILCNAPLRFFHASLLAAIVQRSRRSFNLALVSVVLVNVPLAPVSVVSLACALAQNPSCLQQLVLERCQVGSAGAAALFESLSYNRALWKLDLSGNHIADAACPALSRALLASSQLRVLALSRNFLSDRGVFCYLAPALASSQLETLVLLQNPRVSSMGIGALRQAASTRVVSD